MKLLWYLILYAAWFQVYGQKVEIPKILFQAFKPKGLRIVLKGDSKTELVAFHLKLNQPIGLLEPGDINQDLKKSAKSNNFIYVDTEIELKEKDTLYYWVFIQHNQLGYRKDNLSWTVNELLPEEDLFKPAFNDENTNKYLFTENSIDNNVWQIEEYIPGRPDWPFNFYKNDPSVIYVSDGVLHIVPHLQLETSRGILNLTEKCTRNIKVACFKEGKVFWNPPVVSGQLRFKESFQFRNVTIKAKLPIGDFVYPELYLEDEVDTYKKNFIAFARGNKHYYNYGEDIGGSTLYGGYSVADNLEVYKKEQFFKKVFPEHVGSQWHVFSVTRTNDTIQFYVDNENYATLSVSQITNNGISKSAKYRLVLGVGIAGPRHFPDDYTSGYPKPYKKLARDSIKSFTLNREQWPKTWNQDTQLQVEAVYVESEID